MKTNLWLEKWHNEFGWFPCEQLKVQKFALWLDPCVQSIHILAKLEEKLTLGYKNDLRNLVNFKCEKWQVWNFAFWCAIFANSVWSFSLKSTGKLFLMTLKKDPNFEEKLTFCLKNDVRSLVNCSLSSGKSENLHFDWVLL